MTAIDPRSVRRLRPVALLSYGFRPFFLAAALWALAAMALWTGAMTGLWSLAGAYGPIAWHAHELLFGYASAVIAGFVLTAGANWTGRVPVRDGVLLGLVALWLLGRVALLAVDLTGLVPAIFVESLFLPALATVIGREIVAARNWRNLKIVGLVAALAAANILFHAEIWRSGTADLAIRGGLSLVIALIMVIGGRITPSFTRNWLSARKRTPLPPLHGHVDTAAIGVAALALASWAVQPDWSPTGWMLLVAALAQAIRMARWKGGATWREPLLTILHVGYAFIPLGFALLGVSVLRPDLMPASGALHAWTAGAIGVMTMGVMTRVTLGHTARPLTASPSTIAIYLAMLVAAITRIVAPHVLPNDVTALLVAASIAWMAAFALFVLVYGPMLVRPRSVGTVGC
jgi:uncharacterized protein involved in response to NO